jgi:hypothetical protein
MKRIYALLSVLAFSFSSCDKEETIDRIDLDTKLYTHTANLNNPNGKDYKDRQGNVGPQYFYSQQHMLNIEDLENSEILVNSQDDYNNFVFPKDPNSTLTAVTTAPGDWHFALTQYTTEDSYVENEQTIYNDYPVVGVIVNSQKNMQVAHIQDSNFDSITLEEARAASFSDEADTIGWDWKEYQFSTYTYKILEDNYYLVKLDTDQIIKLRFVDFYGENEAGDVEAGHIKFQFQLLD